MSTPETPEPPNEEVPPSATSSSPDPSTTVGNGKNVVMPSSALKSRLAAATERGKRAALQEFEEQAKQSGFTGVAEMFSTVAEMRKQNNKPQTRQPSPPPPQEDGEHAMPPRTNGHQGNGNDRRSFKDERRYQRQVEQDRQRLEAERKARIKAERRGRDAERARQDAEVRQSIRESVIRAGISDIDYGAFLLEQHVLGKPPEEIEKFDEQKWFEGLRTERPYLFGEVVRPATTGTGPGNPPPPRPGAAINEAAAGAKKDARKMNSVEFREHLRARGLSLDDAGQ